MRSPSRLRLAARLRDIVTVVLAVSLPAACATSHTAPVPTIPATTQATPSGLRYAITHHGNGPLARPGEWALVQYTGALTDGKVFDSSRERAEPLGFLLGAHQVIRGWDEGIALLHVGDRATLVIPPALGYGAKGAGHGVIPPNATLVFDVELVGLRDSAAMPILLAALDRGGPDALRATYRSLAASGRLQRLYFGEYPLERAASTALREKQPPRAIALLQFAAELYPRSHDVQTALAEAYVANHDRANAIAAYRTAIRLNEGKTTGDRADRAEAEAALRKLGATP